MMYQENPAPAVTLENELWEQQSRKNDEDRLYADLTGLYSDIIREIGKTDSNRSHIIYDYAKLLEQEQQLFSSAEAYIMGERCGEQSANDILAEYLNGISQKRKAIGLGEKILTMYKEIHGLLGDCPSLIDEFTETYNAVHGVVKNNLIEFIRLGQNASKAVIE